MKTARISKTPSTPGQCPYKGREVAVPGVIFDEPERVYTAVIKGYNKKRTDQLVAKFDDGTQYWFPLDDVLKWLGEAPPPAADAAADAQHSTLISSQAGGRGRRRTAASPAAAAGGSSDIEATPSSSNQGEAAMRKRSAAAGRQAGVGGKAANTPAGYQDDNDATATADEVFDMPLWQEEEEQQQQQPTDAQLQQAGSSYQQQKDSTGSAGVVAGIVLLLFVMLLAINASKWPAHDLETFLDSLRALSRDAQEKLRSRALV